jgi:hypothetical protein
MELVKYTAARKALAAAHRVDEVKSIRDKAVAMQAYAKQAKDHELVGWATEIRLRAERRAGELLKQMAVRGERDRGKGGDRKSQSQPVTVKLRDLGIEPMQASRWQRAADLSEAAFERKVERATKKSVDSGMFYQPRTIEWWTPREYIDMACEVMGSIDLDPASCVEANKTVKAKRFFDIKADGLTQTWKGRTWLNPPYAGLTGQFVEKLLAEKACGNVTEAIALISATTLEREWFRPLWDAVLCFHYGRVKFTSPDIELIDSQSSPMTASVFIYLGRKEKRFASVFSKVGAIVKRWP